MVDFRSAGGNLFNLLWNAWDPTDYPHPAHGGNLTTSLQSLDDYAASGLGFARVFASPWAASDISALWLDASDREPFWAAMDTILGRATDLGVYLQPSMFIQYASAATRVLSTVGLDSVFFSCDTMRVCSRR